jgi:hypothetical protein
LFKEVLFIRNTVKNSVENIKKKNFQLAEKFFRFTEKAEDILRIMFFY